MGNHTSVSLGEHFEGFIARQVETGRYGNRSEVIRAALREMEERQRKAATLELMERSMADIDAGRTRSAKQALREVAADLGLSLDR
jgi:putative addiction module CopG family antidote